MSSLLSRWNLRRQKVEQEAEADIEASEAAKKAESVAVDTTATEPSTHSEVIEPDEDTVLTADDLPDPEKIEVGGSFASFMGTNVDPAAKSAALKALWKQPHYSEIDGLLEYALDYSNQPKLSADVSAELAKKVFRHVVKEKDDEEEIETVSELESDEMTHAETAAVSDTKQVSDILDDNDDELSQNEPEHSITIINKVV